MLSNGVSRTLDIKARRRATLNQNARALAAEIWSDGCLETRAVVIIGKQPIEKWPNDRFYIGGDADAMRRLAQIQHDEFP